MSNLAEHISKSGCLLGTIISSDSTTVAEAVAISGIDWAFFDLEHSANSLETVQKQIQAVAGRIFTAIRIEAPKAVFVKRALETGCDAIIVPQVNSAAIAKSIVDAGKYSPLGNRSVGISRAQGYGSNFENYLATANSQTSIIIQIENIKAVDIIDEIISVPGIDGLFMGPYDLSSSLGLIGQVQHQDVLKAIEKVRVAAKKFKLPIGLFVAADDAVHQAKKDFQFLLVGTDIGRLIQSLKKTIESKKDKGDQI